MFAWVHLGAPSGGLNNSVSRGISRAHLGVFGLNRVHFGSFARTQGSSGSVRFSWVHSCARRGRRLHNSSSDFGGCAKGSSGLFGFPLVYTGAPSVRRRRSRGFTRARLGVVGFHRRSPRFTGRA